MDLEKITINKKHSIEEMNKLYKSLRILPPAEEWVQKITAEEIPLEAKYENGSTVIIANYRRKISINTKKFKVNTIAFEADSVGFYYKGKYYIFRSKIAKE